MCSARRAFTLILQACSTKRSSVLAFPARARRELSHYLLDKWDIATLPGSAFGEQPEVLRLRLATSMLYSPGSAHAAPEHEASLWRLLDLADTVSPLDHANGPALPLPMLERAQARLTELIRDLGVPSVRDSSHD